MARGRPGRFRLENKFTVRYFEDFEVGWDWAVDDAWVQYQGAKFPVHEYLNCGIGTTVIM